MCMSQLETRGACPGWISLHKARMDGNGGILVSGGKQVVSVDGPDDYIENTHQYRLCLATLLWERLAMS